MKTLKMIALTTVTALSLLVCIASPASAASSATAPSFPVACQNVTWGAMFDESAVDPNVELGLMRKALARASMLLGVTFTYVPVGYVFKTPDGYAGYDYVPSPPTTRVKNSSAPAILFSVADRPDTVLADGTVALGNASLTQGRVTGDYDASALLQYSASLRSDYYYVTVQAYFKGCGTSGGVA